MRRVLLTALLASALLRPAPPPDAAAQKSRPPAHPYASDNPLPEPRLFAPGVVSTGDFESHPAFAPDGRTLYFLKDAPDFSFWTIVSSTFRGGR